MPVKRCRSSHAREPVARSGNIIQERWTHEVVEFKFSLMGNWIKAEQEWVDLSRMTHDQRPFAGTQEVAAELVAIGGVLCKIADAPETVVGPPSGQASPERPRKGRNDEGTRDGNPAAQNPFNRIPALPHIRPRSPGGDKLQDDVTHTRQDVRMLMTVDEIRGGAPCLLERVDLMLEFGPNLRQVELAEKR